MARIVFEKRFRVQRECRYQVSGFRFQGAGRRVSGVILRRPDFCGDEGSQQFALATEVRSVASLRGPASAQCRFCYTRPGEEIHGFDAAGV